MVKAVAPRAVGLPPRAGVGLKPEHVDTILATRPAIGFFEVHAENYMGAGGPPHAQLTAIRKDYPVSLHGVGLSIGGAGPLDRTHLSRILALVERYEPSRFSEHLAWSSHEGTYFNDLLPLPYTRETLERVCHHIDEVQETLGLQMLLENPSTYVAFEESDIDEAAFLAAIVRRTGCGLLLDVNNVYVSAINHGDDPVERLDAFPFAAVGEIHLGGHGQDRDDAGRDLLIDAHDRPVGDAVWSLYARAIDRLGPVPTLIEWDNDVPEWPVLAVEAAAAEAVIAETSRRRRRAVRG